MPRSPVHRLLLFASLSLAACGGAFIDPKPSTATPTGPAPIPETNLRGQVLDQANGAPIAGATVEASGATSTSTADGSYNLQRLQLAAVQLVTSRAGYDTARTLLPLTGKDQVFVIRMKASAVVP